MHLRIQKIRLKFDFQHPVERQIFGDGDGLDPALILALCSKQQTGDCQNHLVCLHPLTVLKCQSHMSKVPVSVNLLFFCQGNDAFFWREMKLIWWGNEANGCRNEAKCVGDICLKGKV